MFTGVNTKQMKQVMKKMGMQQQELDVQEVIFRMGNKDLIIASPSVSKINMMGQETYQVVGEVQERLSDTTPDISEEDIETVMTQVGCSKEEALAAIKTAKGDLAEAIMSFQE